MLVPYQTFPPAAKYKETIKIVHLCSLGTNLANISKKIKKHNCHFQRGRSKNKILRAKAGYCTCPQHSITPEQWTILLSQPSVLTPGYTLTVSPSQEQDCAPLSQWESSGNFSFSFPPASARAPIKPCLNFLSDLYSFLLIGEGQVLWLVSDNMGSLTTIILENKYSLDFKVLFTFQLSGLVCYINTLIIYIYIYIYIYSLSA